MHWYSVLLTLVSIMEIFLYNWVHVSLTLDQTDLLKLTDSFLSRNAKVKKKNKQKRKTRKAGIEWLFAVANTIIFIQRVTVRADVGIYH